MTERCESSASKTLDEDRLHDLGYYQSLKRDWSLVHNFGASFSIISVITGITTLFGYGLNTGGPGVMSIGWLAISFFTLFVAASMAEILSAVPVSGGPYFWAYLLAPNVQAPFFGWVTGLYNLTGQIAVTTGIDFGLANLISTTAFVTNGYHPTPGKTLGILAIILSSHVAFNMFSIHRLRYMIYASIFLNTAGIFGVIIVVLAMTKTHQSAAFTFGKFFDGTGVDGPGWSIRASPSYVAVCGVLMSQYTILGYDASAHLCEETRKAVRHAPYGLLSAVVASIIMGLFVIVGFLFSIEDFDTVRTSPLPVLRIMTDSCGERGGLALMVVIMLCVWHCGLFSLTSNSRMMFAFSRDGGIPHRLHIINKRLQCPIRTVIFGACWSFLLGLPVLVSQVAFAGTTSIATIGLYISYGIPIALTLVYPHNFKRGPFKLGVASKWIAIVACLWISFITVIFCLPTVTPVTTQNLNYTPVALGIVTILIFSTWFLWAHKWFTGRCRDHCPNCIRQLDLLGQELVGTANSTDIGGRPDRHHQLRSVESSSLHGNGITVTREWAVDTF